MKKNKESSLAFDGVSGAGYSRGGQSMAKNAWSGHSNDGREVNYGRGSTVGNDGRCDPPKNTGGNPVKSAHRMPPVSATPAVPAQGSIRDNINRGSQNRGPGGTTVKKPANADSIRIGQSGSVF
jgi:hypothetical protein